MLYSSSTSSFLVPVADFVLDALCLSLTSNLQFFNPSLFRQQYDAWHSQPTALLSQNPLVAHHTQVYIHWINISWGAVGARELRDVTACAR